MQAFPTDRAVRGRFISLLHRMVECLGAVALPFLPASLQVENLIRSEMKRKSRFQLRTKPHLLKNPRFAQISQVVSFSRHFEDGFY